MSHRLDRSGGEPWVPARYPILLDEVDETLDGFPERFRPHVGDLFALRARAHAALQRIWECEARYIASGHFAERAGYRGQRELLFDGPALYSRRWGKVTVGWWLDDHKRRFAEECFEAYETLVDARDGLRAGFWELYEDPPILEFSLDAVLECADTALIASVPVEDLFAKRGEADERRLARYLKRFDTARKAENRRVELETLLAQAGVQAPAPAACPGFDVALALIAAYEVEELFSYCTEKPDQAERSHTVQTFTQLLRASLHAYRHISPTRYASQLIDWRRDNLPVLAELLLEDIEATSTRPWTRSEPFMATLEVLRTAPDRGARSELRKRLVARLASDLGAPAVHALSVLPDWHRAVTLPIVGDVVHLWPSEETEDMTTFCGVSADDETYDAIEEWPRLLNGQGDYSVCPVCRRSRWPHALQQLSPTPGLDRTTHDVVVAIAEDALNQAVLDGHWNDPSHDAVIDALVDPVKNRVRQQLAAQGTSIHDLAIQALDELPESYLKHLQRIAESGQVVTPPVQDESEAWIVLVMSYTGQSDMAFWYRAICRHAGMNPIGVPSRSVRRKSVDDLPHRRGAATRDAHQSKPVGRYES